MPPAAWSCAASVLLAAASTQAQAFDDAPFPAPPPRRFDVEPGLSLLAAAWHAEPTGITMAAAMLAFLENGSTMRSGPYRLQVKELARLLSDRGPAPPACEPLLPRLLAAIAMHQAAMLSNYQPLEGPTAAWITAVSLQASDPARPPLSPEEHCLLRLLVRELDWHRSTAEPDAKAAVRDARVAFRLGASRRADAAHFLARSLAGEAIPDDLLLAMTWPADATADPLHTWFAVVALCTVAKPRRDVLLPQLDRLVAARVPAGAAEHAGTWAPAGDFDRLTTTALFTMCLGIANQQSLRRR